MIKLTYMSADTNKIIQEDINKNIVKYAKRYRIDAALIKAIIQQESRFNTFAIRYEPHLKKTKWYARALTKSEIASKYSFCSMGVMQILFATAKDMGYEGSPHDLLEPRNSIEYGVKYLKSLIKRFYYLNDVVSAYNAGRPLKIKDSKYKNQKYVNAVLRNYKKYKKTP